MWLRAINVISQITIIILAVVIVITMSKKQMMDSTFNSFEAKINARLDEDHKRYTERINTVQNNLNIYQLNREQRAQLYSKRIDELYELYKKDPNSIDSASSSYSGKVAASTLQPDKETQAPVLLDKNFNYVETRINKIDERLDVNYNKLDVRLNILEQRINLLNSNRNSNVKVIQNNLNNQTITGTLQ